MRTLIPQLFEAGARGIIETPRSDAVLAATIGELSALLRNKRKLLKQLCEDLRLQATLEFWLYFHVPLTIALLVALAVHITTVFVYW